MTGFSDFFGHHVVPTEAEISKAITEGLVALDSNVLLSAYRFAPHARLELLDALDLLGDRLWIPHQVGLEFHRNRYSVILEHDAAYVSLIHSLNAQQQAQAELAGLIRELANRTALPPNQRDRLLGMLSDSLSPLVSAIQELRQSHGVGQPSSKDEILERFQRAFAGKIGDPFSKADEGLELTEAERRISSKIPPGYKDSKKEEAHGDYFVWRQTLNEVAKRSSISLVFVTNDVKEDWYLRLKGQTIMARPELISECQDSANARLFLLPIQSFLRFAKKDLKATVSDETLEQADRVLVASRVTELEESIESATTELHQIRVDRNKAENGLNALIAGQEGDQMELARLRMELQSMEDYREANMTSKGTQAIAEKRAEIADTEVRLAHSNARLQEYYHTMQRLASHEQSVTTWLAHLVSKHRALTGK